MAEGTHYHSTSQTGRLDLGRQQRRRRRARRRHSRHFHSCRRPMSARLSTPSLLPRAGALVHLLTNGTNGCLPARRRSCPRRHSSLPRRQRHPRHPRRRRRRRPRRRRPTCSASATRAQDLSAGRFSTLRRPSQAASSSFSSSTMFASGSPQVTSGWTQIGRRRCRAIWWQQGSGGSYEDSRGVAQDI